MAAVDNDDDGGLLELELPQEGSGGLMLEGEGAEDDDSASLTDMTMSGTEEGSNVVNIVGRLADPAAKENWEDDFDLDGMLSDGGSDREVGSNRAGRRSAGAARRSSSSHHRKNLSSLARKYHTTGEIKTPPHKLGSARGSYTLNPGLLRKSGGVGLQLKDVVVHDPKATTRGSTGNKDLELSEEESLDWGDDDGGFDGHGDGDLKLTVHEYDAELGLDDSDDDSAAGPEGGGDDVSPPRLPRVSSIAQWQEQDALEDYDMDMDLGDKNIHDGAEQAAAAPEEPENAAVQRQTSGPAAAAAAAAANDTDSDGDFFEDWDREMDLDNEEHKQNSCRLKKVLQDLLRDSDLEDEADEDYHDAAHGDGDMLSPDLDLLRLLAKPPSAAQAMHIVMYPPPSQLFSMRTADNLPGLGERQLEEWLRTIVSKHAPKKRGKEQHQDDDDGDDDAVKQPQVQQQAWSAEALEGAKEPLPTLLNRCLARIVSLSVEAEQQGSSQQQASVGEAWRLAKACFAYLGSTDKIKVLQDDAGTFGTVYSILQHVARLWDRRQAKHMLEFVQTAKRCFPQRSSDFELLELEWLAHHDGRHANRILRMFCLVYLRNKRELTKEGKGGSKPQQKKKPAAQEGDDQEEYRESGDDVHRRQVFQRCALRSLTSLSLYLNNLSPMDTRPLRGDAEWDQDAPGFRWLDSAWLGQDPPQTAHPELERAAYELCGKPDRRVQLMSDLYRALGPSYSALKATAAYVLGQNACLAAQDGAAQLDAQSKHAKVPMQRAERLLYECLHILDSLQGSPAAAAAAESGGSSSSSACHSDACLHGVGSALGSNALVLYGDVLLARGKYKYGILAYEAALEGLQRRDPAQFYQLCQRLCDVCPRNEDMPRAVQYHRILMGKAERDGDLNLYVYLVQQTAKQEVQLGNYRKAEQALRGALRLLHPFTKSASAADSSSATATGGGAADSRSDSFSRANAPQFEGLPPANFVSATVSVYLLLAKLYLRGDRVSNAVLVLEMLAARELPRAKQRSVQLLLARAYMCSGRHARAERLAGLIPSEGDNAALLALLELRANNLLWSGDPVRALPWARQALHHVPKSSYASMAAVYMRLGEVHQQLLFDHGVASPPEPRPCARSFREAQSCLAKLGDEAGITRAELQICDAYLHVAMQAACVRGAANAAQSLRQWLKLTHIDYTGVLDPWEHFLREQEATAMSALQTSAAGLHVEDMLRSYLCLAEALHLQGREDASLQYWTAAHDGFSALCLNGPSCTFAGKGSPAFLRPMRRVLERLVRLLLCFRPAVINAHLRLLDAHQLLAVQLFTQRRSGERADRQPRKESRSRSQSRSQQQQQQQQQQEQQEQQEQHQKQQQRKASGGDDKQKNEQHDVDQHAAGARVLRPAWKASAWGAWGTRHNAAATAATLEGDRQMFAVEKGSDAARVQQLSEKACFQLARLRQETGNRFSRNHSALTKLLARMDRIRALCGHEPVPWKEGSSTIDPMDDLSSPRAARPATPLAAGGSSSSSSGLEVAAARRSPPRTGRRLAAATRRGTVYATYRSAAVDAAAATAAEEGEEAEQREEPPLWGNVIYCVALHGVMWLYSPSTQVLECHQYTSVQPKQQQVRQQLSLPSRPPAAVVQQAMQGFLSRQPTRTPASSLPASRRGSSSSGLGASSGAELGPSWGDDLRECGVARCMCIIMRTSAMNPGVCTHCWHTHEDEEVGSVVAAAGTTPRASSSSKGAVGSVQKGSKAAPRTSPAAGLDRSTAAGADAAAVADEEDTPPSEYHEEHPGWQAAKKRGGGVQKSPKKIKEASPLRAAAAASKAEETEQGEMMRDLCRCLDPQNLLGLVGALFAEARVVCVSGSASNLHAAFSCLPWLITPFRWQHTFVPLLAPACASLLDVDEPLLCGMARELFEQMVSEGKLKRQRGQTRPIVVVDLDNNTLRGSALRLPPGVHRAMHRALFKFCGAVLQPLLDQQKKQQQHRVKAGPANPRTHSLWTRSDSLAMPRLQNQRSDGNGGGGGIAPELVDAASAAAAKKAELKRLHMASVLRVAIKSLRAAFLEALVSLFHTYRLFFERQGDRGGFSFNEKAWIAQSPPHAQSSPRQRSFLQRFAHTSCFRMFLEERPAHVMDGDPTAAAFDVRAQRWLTTEHKATQLLCTMTFEEEMKLQCDGGRWKRRWLVIKGHTLLVCKSKKNRRTKFELELKPGMGQLVIFQVEPSEEHFTLELRFRDSQPSCVFRAETLQSKNAWLQLLQARFMHPSLKAKYARCALGLGGGVGDAGPAGCRLSDVSTTAHLRQQHQQHLEVSTTRPRRRSGSERYSVSTSALSPHRSPQGSPRLGPLSADRRPPDVMISSHASSGGAQGQVAAAERPASRSAVPEAVVVEPAAPIKRSRKVTRV